MHLNLAVVCLPILNAQNVTKEHFGKFLRLTFAGKKSNCCGTFQAKVKKKKKLFLLIVWISQGDRIFLKASW